VGNLGHNAVELCDICMSLSAVRLVKCRRLLWAVHVVRLGGRRKMPTQFWKENLLEDVYSEYRGDGVIT
jgi:hypothetical protein